MRPSPAFAVPRPPSLPGARHWFRLAVITATGAVALAVVLGAAP